MRIGIDIRKYFDFGIGTYIQNLAKQFDSKTEVELTYFAAPKDVAYVGKHHRGNVVPNSSGKYSLQELFSLSMQANRTNVDVYHAPHYTLPLMLKARRVVTIHDLIHLRFPQYFSAVQRPYARFMIGHACSAADVVIVDSHFTKGDLASLFPSAEKKVEVIHLGVGPQFVPGGSDLEGGEFRRTYGIRERYLLCVGSLKPHKNIPCLLRAFAGLHGFSDVQLVCVGERVEDQPVLGALCLQLGLENRVRSLGWLPEKDLVTAYRSAAAVVLPSLYEGFGFSALEAMACGTAVIGSKAASIPEVIGDAGLLVDPTNQDELQVAIERLLEDSSLRTSLREKGLKQAERFTWDLCAEQTLNVYRSLV